MKCKNQVQIWKGYRLQLPYLKCDTLCNYFNYFINVTDYIWLLEEVVA